MLKIRVTKDDIAKGNPMHCSLCPIARALRRATNDRVVVKSHSVTIGRLRHGGKEYILPEKAANFIYLFDQGCGVKPFTFTLTQSV